MKNLFKKRRAACSVLALVATSIAMDVHAATQTKSGCTVTSIQYDENRLAVWCEGDSKIYYAFKDKANCQDNSLTTLKWYITMFQSALMTGRDIDFRYTPAADQATCEGGVDTILWGVKVY